MTLVIDVDDADCYCYCYCLYFFLLFPMTAYLYKSSAKFNQLAERMNRMEAKSKGFVKSVLCARYWLLNVDFRVGQILKIMLQTFRNFKTISKLITSC